MSAKAVLPRVPAAHLDTRIKLVSIFTHVHTLLPVVMKALDSIHDHDLSPGLTMRPRSVWYVSTYIYIYICLYIPFSEISVAAGRKQRPYQARPDPRNLGDRQLGARSASRNQKRYKSRVSLSS